MFDQVGAKTYMAILQSARVNKYPIGPKYHLHDYHFKLWCKGKTEEEIARAYMTPKQKKKMEKEMQKAAKKASKKEKTQQEKIQAVLDRIQRNDNKGTSRVIASTSTQVAAVPPPLPKKQTEKQQAISDKEKDEALKEAWRKAKMKALADTLKCQDRLAHVKSVGNGL